MKNLLHQIHETNHYSIAMKAQLRPFNLNLDRWHEEDNPEHYNNNFFVAKAPLTCEDVAEALEYQKKLGVHHFLLKAQEPLDESIVEEFGLEPDHTYIMALLNKAKTENWKINDSIVVKDSHNEDICDEIYAHAIAKCPEQYRHLVEKSMSEAMKLTKAHPEYHWFAAYKEGKIVGNCYILRHHGYMEFDDLAVDKEHRKQYIATTIMKYIGDHFDETIYLHAAVNKTPKNMYGKMGFEIVETSYEYFKEWNE